MAKFPTLQKVKPEINPKHRDTLGRGPIWPRNTVRTSCCDNCAKQSLLHRALSTEQVDPNMFVLTWLRENQNQNLITVMLRLIGRHCRVLLFIMLLSDIVLLTKEELINREDSHRVTTTGLYVSFLCLLQITFVK